mgnify:CR=1 FL=1
MNAIITNVSKFNKNGLWYVIWKEFFGDKEELTELFGCEDLKQESIKYAKFKSKSEPKNLKVGQVWSNVEFIPMEKWEMSAHLLYDDDGVPCGNLTKATCFIGFNKGGKTTNTDTYSEDEVKEMMVEEEKKKDK